jgi:hypothetical protein
MPMGCIEDMMIKIAITKEPGSGKNLKSRSAIQNGSQSIF